MALTGKQQRFVEEYLVDLNATQAAIRAGYSEKTAYSQGQRLLKNVEVGKMIGEAKEERAAETGIDARWVLQRLGMEVEADLADIYDESGNLLPVKDWPLIWRTGLVAGVETVREGGDGGMVSYVDKIKISDRIKRIELIGKHVDVQAFKDRIEQSGSLEIVVTGEDAAL